MNDNNNIDKKLRQLENQSLPDMSKQDEHWQQMKNMLEPSLTPAKPVAYSKIWTWIAAACVATAVILFSQKSPHKETHQKEEIATASPIQQKNIVVETKEKLISSDTLTEPVTVQKNNTSLVIRKVSDNEEKKYATPISQKCDGCGTDWLNDTTVKNSNNLLTKNDDDSKAKLAAFFAQLEKPSQEFVIDNSRDTLIYGKDGTSLLIPANTFNTKEKVTIILKEYYSYEDIITNKLTTTSDGKQLVSGGMIQLLAVANGKSVNIKPQKNIRWFVPDTTSDMKDMQVFTGSENRNMNEEFLHLDTMATGNSSINWRASGNGFNDNFINIQVKVLDLRDLPYKTTVAKKYKGHFFQNSESDLTKDELKELLQKKYSYDKVIIAGKRKKKEWKATWFVSTGFYNAQTYYSLGDTIWTTPQEAKIYKLQAFDTITYSNRSSVQKNSPSLNNQLKYLAGKYSVDIYSLGWINCDKFYNDNRSKIEYIVNLGDTSSNYHTFLAFDKIKSMMPGYTSGNKVIFSNVPNGETAKVISVGIKDGKPVAAMQSVQISRTTLTGLKFEETTPSGFKQQVAVMDK